MISWDSHPGHRDHDANLVTYSVGRTDNCGHPETGGAPSQWRPHGGGSRDCSLEGQGDSDSGPRGGDTSRSSVGGVGPARSRARDPGLSREGGG